MNTYTIGEFAKLTGYSVKTLQRWDRQKRLVPLRTPTNRRIYTDEQILVAQGRSLPMPVSRRTVVYMRVSSQAQRPDLKNQRLALEQFCQARGWAVDDWLEEIGGGLNMKRPKLLAVVDDLVAGHIERLIIAHKDRLARFGFEMIDHLAQMHNAEIVILNTESLSPEQEMVQDLMMITHCFSARLYGLRNYRKALKKAIGNDTCSQDSA